MAKNKGWRPIKLTKERIQVADKVLNGDVVKYSKEVLNKDWDVTEVEKEKRVHEYRAIFLSDEELVEVVNMKLEEIGEEELTFDYRTFQNYKARWKWNDEELKPLRWKQKDLFEEFFRLIKKHLILQKQSLFQKFQDSSVRQKYAWIIERKFEEWNLKKISESTHKTDPENPFKIIIENPYHEED